MKRISKQNKECYLILRGWWKEWDHYWCHKELAPTTWDSLALNEAYALDLKFKTDPSCDKCDYCGIQNKTVMIVNDPYSEEINNELIEVNICSRCYRERRDDI